MEHAGMNDFIHHGFSVFSDAEASGRPPFTKSTATNGAHSGMHPTENKTEGANGAQFEAKTEQQKSSTKENIEQLRSGFYTIRAADVTPKRIDAIWTDSKGGIRLARGEHTLIAGEPGLGKSQLEISIAAAISTGGSWPCGEGSAPLGDVIILATEDSVEHTLVPRLIAAGADCSRIHFVQAVATKDGKGRRSVNFQLDFENLKKLVKATKEVVLVNIDPMTAYMGNVDSHKNAEVRGVLSPLGELANECNVAIASVTHFTKGTGKASTKAIDRFIGSIAFIAAPRIGLTVVADPEDLNRRLLLHVKNNISRPPQGLAFRIEQRVIGTDEKGELLGSCLAWESVTVEKTADEVVARKGDGGPTAKDDAIEFLNRVLAGGPQKVTDIEIEARDAGLLAKDQRIGQSKPFRAAREALGIKPYQPKGLKAAGWYWALSGDQMPSDGSDAQ
jgi:putative DNA primase/helicase